MGTFATCRPVLKMSVNRGYAGSGRPTVKTTRMTQRRHLIWSPFKAQCGGICHQLDLYEPFELSLDVSLVPQGLAKDAAWAKLLAHAAEIAQLTGRNITVGVDL